MLLLGSSFTNMSLLSLRTGSAVGKVVGHLINPHKLNLDALWCKMNGERSVKLLLVQDIREVSIKGVVINDYDVAIEASEVVRLKSIIDLNYTLLDKKVISGHLPIGKVCDYAIDAQTFVIQKVYATPSVLAKLKASRLTIDRSQIIEVSHKYVKVTDSRTPFMARPKSRSINQSSLSSAASASTTSE